MNPATRNRDPYLVKSIVHSSELLAVFRYLGEALSLHEISTRSGLPKTMSFRLLYTLEKCGMIDKIGDNLYQSRIRPLKQKRYKIGYASQGATDYQFSTEVSNSVLRAARAEGIELVSLDNKYDPRIAQRNADLFVKENVDLVIEFQTDENVAEIVAAKYREANIPLVAIDIPHPGATYYGGNNYEAGLIGGRYLGRWAKKRWQGEVHEIVMFQLSRAGNLPKMRVTGMMVGLKEVLPSVEKCQVTFLDGDGKFHNSFDAMRNHLRRNRHKRLLVGAINDASALGALRAFQEAGQTECCAVMGQNASLEGRMELRLPETRLIGSVAFFPEKYGDELIGLAIDILNHRVVPPATFVKHQLITSGTVNHFYPNDCLFEGHSTAALTYCT